MIKSLFFCFLIFSFIGCGGGSSSTPTTTTTSQTADVSGTWRGAVTSSVVSNGNVNIEITFSQSGSSVSGTLACYAGTLSCVHNSGIVTGTVTGLTLVIQGFFFPDNHSCTTSNIAISGNIMSGQYNCSGDPQSGDNGTFALNKVATSSSLSNISGTWNGTSASSSLDGFINVTVSYSQSSNSLSGTYTCTTGTLACVHSSGTVTGTIQGNIFTGQIVFPDTHSCGIFSTTVSGNTITGQGSCDDPSGDKSVNNFTLTKQ